MRTFITSLALVTLIAGAGNVAAAQTVAATVSLEQRAAQADSPAEHAEVAKEYRQRAESFEAKAEQHEAQATKLQRAAFPYEKKMAAVLQRPWAKERQLAIEARRAAREAIEAGQRHTQLAVELLASR